MRSAIPLLMICIVPGCAREGAGSSQRQGLASPSGRYVVSMPIQENTTDPGYLGTPVWKVTISNAEGLTLYRDENSTFVGTLNVYWGWDDADILWLYNSDDGRIWRWEQIEGEWKKIEGEGLMRIPSVILPDYAKAR